MASMLGVDAESDALDILPIDAAEKRPRRGRRQGDAERRVPRHWIAVALALAAAAGAAYWFFGPGDGEPDGLEAESAEFDDLLDGQTVRIEVEGLPSLAATVTVQCAAGGQEAALECDPTTARRASSSSNGTLDAGTTVWRVISTSNQGSYDCARQACELRTFPALADGSIATTVLGFDPQNTAALPPAISTRQDAPTSDKLITLTSAAFAEGTTIQITGCTIGVEDDPIACDPLWDEEVTIGSSGLDHEISPGLWQGNFETRCNAGCRIDFELPDVRRQPFSIHLPASNRAGLYVDTTTDEVPTELTVTPSTGLLDGQEVTLTATGLTNEMGLYLCAVSTSFDCSWLGAPITADEQTVRVPRAFMSWQGGVRDCAEIECEIVILGPMSFENQIAAPVSFDASVPLAAGRPLSISADGPLADGETVVLSIDPNEGAMEWPNMAVCAVDLAQACEYVDPDFSDSALTVTLYRTLMTPTGPFDCVDDGACQLNVWIDGRTSRFEPLLLEFDPDAPPARQYTTITLRPGGPISDGDTVSMTVRGLQDDEFVAFASICVTGETRCAFLGGVDRGPGSSVTLDFEVRRVVMMQSAITPGAASPVDCLETQCEIRLSNTRSEGPATLMFKDEPALPNPRVALGVDGPLPVGEIIEIRGRDFTFISLDDNLWIDVHLCHPTDEPGGYGSCYGTGSISPDGIDVDSGTFQGTIIVPSNPPITRLGGGEACQDECVLIVFDGAGPPGILPVTIDR